MFELFRGYYPARPGESEEAIHDLLMSEILSLNGKQSIFQMIQFHDRVRERGGVCPTPEELLHQYQSRLDGVIAQRMLDLREGRAKPDDYVIYEARSLLDKLKQHGLCLIILSGTIQHRVEEEAELLGLAPYFGRHIYGSTLDHSQFSKKMVIDRLLREEAISGGHLLGLGDGPIEIQEVKAAGGIAIAVATDEENNGSGKVDEWKRQQLLKAGADAVIADYRNSDGLMNLIFGA